MSQVFYPQCRAILSVVFDGFGAKDGIIDPFNQNAGDSDPTIIQVVPREATVNLTGYKEADTWSLNFDAKALPISPELIRSMNVEIYMFDALSVNPTVEAFAQPQYLLCAGLADNTSMEYSAEGRSFVCDGRDYTALLLDKHWDPTKTVPHGIPLDQAVQQIVDEAVQAKTHGGRTLTVEYVSEKAIPVVGVYHTKTNKKGKPVKKGETAWDVIYKMCMTTGCIVFVRGFKVIITDPQTLTLQNANKARKVAYGRNLSSLKIERKLGKEKVPQVTVTSYSSKIRDQISATFPEDKDPVTTGIGTKKDEQTFLVVDGVDDVATLRRYAESYYNSIARGEAKMHFITKSLVDLGNLDMLGLRCGDPVVIGFDPFNDVLMESSTPDQRYQYMIEQGYTPTVSALVATEYERIEQFKKPFYTRDVQVQWAAKEGLTLDVEAVNFVSVNRDDVTAKNDPSVETTKLPKSTDNSSVDDPDPSDDGNGGDL